MTAFADFDFYTKEYLCDKKAVIDTASFDFYAKQATQYIRQQTFGNINEDAEIPNCVKMCCCEIAELLYKSADNERSGITSEKVGDLSVSYESAESQGQALSKNIKSAIYLWLSGTGLLYRGV
ncbi:MAG: hypothetical protein ACI4RM_02870 [Ruminococcus sp.]